MGEFQQNLSSIQWWLGVVLVGVLLNVLSAYLKPWLDKLMSSVSQTWMNHSKAKKEQRERLVAMLKKDATEHFYVFAEEVRARLLALLYMALSVLMLVLTVFVETIGTVPEISVIAIYFFSLLLMFMSMRSQFQAIYLKTALREARGVVLNGL